ncbi:MAG: helix-turn-helix transcriptional regulator, partial [Bacteroidales bacterium]|nr:helix-turn-helix transcriptional regulator [Bacteroidales bacterium]
MSIGENIKQIRERNGLTQKELGDILGVSDKAVSTWERGEKIPRMGTIQKIANYFNTAAGTLIGEEGARHGVHSDTVYTLTTREIRLVESPASGSDFISSA